MSNPLHETLTHPLTEQQLNFFNTFGYITLPSLMNDCIDQIMAGFERVWEANGGGHGGEAHDGKFRSSILPFPGQDPFLASLLDEPRIHDIAASILGDDFNYTGGDGNLYVGDTQWHSDGYSATRQPSIKIAFYLDPMDRETGALRVIPGSHRVGDVFADAVENGIMHKDYSPASMDNWGIRADEVPAIALETRPGDVAVFYHNTKHSAFGGSQRRRMYTMNFGMRYPEDRTEEFAEMISNEARFLTDTLYGPHMVENASPQRMVHLEQGLKHDHLLKARYAELMVQHAAPSRG